MSIELVMLFKHLAPSPLVFNLSQCQSLFQWIVSSHQVAKVLELQLQHQSFQCIFSVDFLEDGLVWSPCSFALVITFIKIPLYPHFLISLVSLLCCVLCFVSQSGLTLCGSMDCSPSGSSVHGILQARILEWVTMPSSRGSSQPRDQTQVSHIAGRFCTVWATREVLCYEEQ